MEAIDVNGDGLTDWVRHLYADGQSHKNAWLNKGDGTWQEALEYAPPYPIYSRGFDDEGMQAMDVNGDGLTDWIRHLFENGQSHKNAWLSDSEAPDILVSVTDSQGLVTIIQNKAIT